MRFADFVSDDQMAITAAPTTLIMTFHHIVSQSDDLRGKWQTEW